MMLTVSVAPSIPFTHGEHETTAKHRTPASSSPNPMTPLSLMMETPSKPFDDLFVSEIVESSPADEGTVDRSENHGKNDTAVSDEDQRAKGLVTFEESPLLKKTDKVENKLENAEGEKPPKQIIASSKSRIQKKSKEKMKMIAGKK